MPGSMKWMAAFWLSVAATAVSFFCVHPLAGWLMLPTQVPRSLLCARPAGYVRAVVFSRDPCAAQVWVSIAAKLNWDIVQLNAGHK